MEQAPVGDKLLVIGYEIESLRRKLDRIFLMNYTNDYQKVLKISKKMDDLIVEYHKIKEGF